LWNLNVEEPMEKPFVLAEDRDSIAWCLTTSDSHWLVVGYENAGVRRWNLKVDNPAKQAGHLLSKGSDQSLTPPAVRWRAGLPDEHTVSIQNLSLQDPVAGAASVSVDPGPVTSWGFSSDGDWLRVQTKDRTRLWDLKNAPPPAGPIVVRHESVPVSSFVVDPT